MEQEKKPLTITLRIAGKPYQFTIDREREEIYRLGEREVNACFAKCKQSQKKGWIDFDYLVVTALQFAMTNVYMRQSREVGSEDLKRLDSLSEELVTYLESQLKE